MPRSHSELFTKLIVRGNDRCLHLPAFGLRYAVARDKIGYEALSDLLRETNDAQFGIVSILNDKNEWVRDATHALPLDERIAHDTPVIHANNALLRCLSRLRPIDYAIAAKLGADQAQSMREELRQSCAQLCFSMLCIANNPGTTERDKRKAIEQAERQFNTHLLSYMHRARLTEGCVSSKDAERLLFHYRILSSVLTPARPMITLTYDKTAKVLQRETQFPVTKKTEVQKKTSSLSENKKPQKSSVPAFKEADRLFAPLIVSDDRALPAQARKSQILGAKNAFIVKTELMSVDDASQLTDPVAIDSLQANAKEDVLWFARMGSPVFVGSEASYDSVQQHTRHNLAQIRLAATERMGEVPERLHVMTLNTDSLVDSQSVIVTHVRAATRLNDTSKDDMSYLPINLEGTFRATDIATKWQWPGALQAQHAVPMQKKQRLDYGVDIFLAAQQLDNVLTVVHCASGQDRTGTLIEKATQQWMHTRYAAHHLDSSNIEMMRTQGANAAEIVTHHVHGSPGMKKDSIANNLFGAQSAFSSITTEALYRESADTNRYNPVGNVAFLRYASSDLIAEYRRYQQLCQQWLSVDEQNNLQRHARIVLRHVDAIVKEEPEHLSSDDLQMMIDVLSAVNACMSVRDNIELWSTYSQKMADLSQSIAHKAWTQLKDSLLLLATYIAVIALCFIAPFAIPALLSHIETGARVSDVGLFGASQKHALARSVQALHNEVQLKEDDDSLPHPNL